MTITVIVSMCCCSSTETKVMSQNSSWEMVWNDEFDINGSPDATKWSYDLGDACDLPAGCGWGNHELQNYTNSSKNARVEDGKLVIELLKEKIGNSDYSSSRLVSKGKGDWKYGKIEVKAKIPNQLGVWSAIWMLSTDNQYKGWPHSGEIDIMENVGYDADTIVGTAHTLDYHHSIGTHKKGTIYNPTASSQFHIYGLNWDENKYELSLDGEVYFTFHNEGKGFESWPFDQRFHLIMNIAYGGDWGGKLGIAPELLPAKMYVDYVRVYQKQNHGTR